MTRAPRHNRCGVIDRHLAAARACNPRPLYRAWIHGGITYTNLPNAVLWRREIAPCDHVRMRKDVREFIRRLEAQGLTVKSTPSHYHVYRDGKPLRKANGMPVTLPFSPDTTRWRHTAILDLRKLGIDV